MVPVMLSSSSMHYPTSWQLTRSFYLQGLELYNPSIPPPVLNTSFILNALHIVVLPGPSRISHFLQQTLPLWLQSGRRRFSLCSHWSRCMPPLCHTWKGASRRPKYKSLISRKKDYILSQNYVLLAQFSIHCVSRTF